MLLLTRVFTDSAMRRLGSICLYAIWALFAVLAGCAAPQYQTNVSLIPPVDAAGRACVQACETSKLACQADCQSRFRACAESIEPRVEARYTEALSQFENDLGQYVAALRSYEVQLSFAWMNSYPFYPYGWGRGADRGWDHGRECTIRRPIQCQRFPRAQGCARNWKKRTVRPIAVACLRSIPVSSAAAGSA
jgi:hypothetical protein